MGTSKQGKFYPLQQHTVNGCHGPCNQGRDACPTPWACEVEEPPPWRLVYWEDVAIATIATVVVCLIVLGVL